MPSTLTGWASLQSERPVYLALNKPAGVVSATKDSRHPTVLDLVHHSRKDARHIAGRLEILSAYRARLSLVEGKYHQVKRMFGPFRNKVLSLHRVSGRPVSLNGLEPGATRPVDDSELAGMSQQVFGTQYREVCP